MQQRNSSLRESQELLAQRMAAPAGLVRCHWLAQPGLLQHAGRNPLQAQHFVR